MSAEPTRRLEILAEMSRPQVEALQLELRRLAKQHGIPIERIRVERIIEET